MQDCFSLLQAKFFMSLNLLFIEGSDLRNNFLQKRTELPAVDLIGGKGASLAHLNCHGFSVPDFCCITTNVLEQVLIENQLNDHLAWMANPSEMLPSELKKIPSDILTSKAFSAVSNSIECFIAKYPNARFAVRSSATLEDGVDSSFAGLLETKLNVQTHEQVLQALLVCWSSLFDFKVAEYLYQRNINNRLRLAVILQLMVPADKSGVLFSIDPVLGNDTEMLIEASYGLGESVVSGNVTPDQYRYDWYNDRETSRCIGEKTLRTVTKSSMPFTHLEAVPFDIVNAACLTPLEVKKIALLALEIQVVSGYPVDMEWSMVGEELYVLQSRPITKIGYAGIDGEWTTADLRDGGVSSSVCTPYMASLYESVMNSASSGYLKRLGLPVRKREELWMTHFFGRPYWNLHATKHYLRNIPDFNERAFDKGLGITPRYSGSGLVSKNSLLTFFYGFRALVSIEINARKKLSRCKHYCDIQKKRLTDINSINLSTISDSDLFILYEDFLLNDYFRNERTYFEWIFDNSNVNALFKAKLDKLGVEEVDFSLLLSGLSGVSHLAQINAMWDVRDCIEANLSAQVYWQETSSSQISNDYFSGERKSGLDSLEDFLSRFGHHAKRELDLLVPRYKEAPTYVVAEIKNILSQPRVNDPRQRVLNQQQRALNAQKKLASSIPVWRRKRIMANLSRVRKFLWGREELRDLSTKFYYHVRRITVEVEGRLIKNKVLLEANDVFFLQKDDLIKVIRGELSSSDCQFLVERNKKYYQSFSNYNPEGEIGDRYSTQLTPPNLETTDSAVFGVGGSPGVVTGVARVIADIDDAQRLEPDDILVTRCTDPAWTAKFSSLAGVVTETGGILSHAAVICREYGIPAVLAFNNATKRIKEGDIISINGSTGNIIFDVGNEE